MITKKFLLKPFFVACALICTGGLIIEKTFNSFTTLVAKNDLKEINNSSQDRNSTLLIGLRSHIGKSLIENGVISRIKLASNGRQLFLKDRNGIIVKSNQIIISWKKIPLTSPKVFNRKVSSSFASFESAERLADDLRSKGFDPLIANPKGWEIWLSESSAIPEGNKFSQISVVRSYELKPILNNLDQDILLSGPIEIEAPDGLLWNGGVYFGPFILQTDSYGTWTFIEKVPIERYLLGVVPYEIGQNAPQSAIAAQAVLARTWALANSHRYAIDGYNLCNHTQCQVYKSPVLANKAVSNAILMTKGKYLSWRKEPIHAVYHASNGGVMAASQEAWAMDSLPYFKSRLDGSEKWVNNFQLPLKNDLQVKSFLEQKKWAYGNEYYRFRWKRNLSDAQIRDALTNFTDSSFLPKKLQVLKRGDSGRVLSLSIEGESAEKKVVLELDEIRRVFKSLPSTLFVIQKLRENVWAFSGGGFGHGVGLSQVGAIDLASRGWNAKKILKYYYPGTTYRSLPLLPKDP